MKTRSQCVCCNSENIKDIINLGWHPFADTFIPKKSVNELENLFPLICSICLKCKNIQDLNISLMLLRDIITLSTHTHLQTLIFQRVIGIIFLKSH